MSYKQSKGTHNDIFRAPFQNLDQKMKDASTVSSMDSCFSVHWIQWIYW